MESDIQSSHSTLLATHSLCSWIGLSCLSKLVTGYNEQIIVNLIYSKTSLIRTHWERTLVQISESLNYRSATENMFREVIKWTSRVFLDNATLFQHLDCIS
jgi:hypothetical protein